MLKGIKGFQKGNTFGVGRITSGCFKKGHIPWMKNKKHSKESRERIRFARAKQPSVWLGKKHPGFSMEYKNKMKMIAHQKGYGKWMIGKKLSEETRKKIGDAIRGEKNWAWKGGITNSPYPSEWTTTLRLAIRQRDNFICQLCGITEKEHLEKLGRVLSVNHIDFDKTNCDPKNLNTLCVSCNSSINNSRNYWAEYFQNQAFGIAPFVPQFIKEKENE